MQVTSGVAIDLARRRTWAEVNLDAISGNIRAIRGLLPETCQFMAVVKADGYGHGMEQVAQAAAQAGATWFGVATLDEGLALRAAGFREPALILGALPPEDLIASVLPRPPLSVTIASPEMFEALVNSPVADVRVHLEVDTGMTRLGILPDDVPPLLDALVRLRPQIALEGCYTHLATADDPDASLTQEQLARFARVAAAVHERFPHAVIHVASSAGAIAYPDAQFDMVRIGLSMYGIYPGSHLQARVALKPAMRLLSRVVRTLRVPAGTPVSYGATYHTSRSTVITTVPCGYADGYPRQASGRGQVAIHGRRYPVVGRVNMDYLMIDAGDAGLQVGDEVELFGNAVSVDELAGWAGSVSYQVLCGVGPRVPRVFVRDGHPVDVRGPR